MRKLFGKRNVAAPGDPAAVTADKTGEEHEHGTSLATSLGLSRAQLAHALTTYGYVAFWIVTSAGAHPCCSQTNPCLFCRRSLLAAWSQA
jgi:hypothetical protein